MSWVSKSATLNLVRCILVSGNSTVELEEEEAVVVDVFFF
jgi:hypothetical protein